jgi:hypothetical protein
MARLEPDWRELEPDSPRDCIKDAWALESGNGSGNGYQIRKAPAVLSGQRGPEENVALNLIAPRRKLEDALEKCFESWCTFMQRINLLGEYENN